MSTISVQEIEQDPGAFLRRLESGEALLVVQGDRPLATISPLPAPIAPLRPYGLCAGQFVVPEEFDEALPNDFLEDFEGH